MYTTVKKCLSGGCGATATIFGGYLSSTTNRQLFSHCESKSKTESKCAAYNSFYDIFFEKRREELCRREPGCTFRGKGITGTCYPKYKTAKFSRLTQEAVVASKETKDGSVALPSSSPRWSDISTATSPSQKPPSQSITTSPTTAPTAGNGVVVNGEGIEDSQIYIEGLMKQQFTSSVADQIVNSHQAARQVAKDLVIEVLQNKETVNSIVDLLGKCFAYPTVQAPIRSLAYFYLHTDVTMANILWQLEWQRNYFFSGDGKEWTETKLKDLFVWWLHTENFREVVYPLVFWVLRDRDIAVVPLSQMNAEYYNYYQEWFAQTLETAVVDHLKAEREHLKVAASEGIRELLISNFKTKSGAEESKPPPETMGIAENDSTDPERT